VSPVRTVRLVTGRELLDRLRNKAFTYGTLAVMALIVAGIVIPTLLDGDEGREHRLGVVGDAPGQLDAALRAQLPEGDRAVLVELGDRDAAARAIEEDEVDAVLLDSRQLMVEGGAPIGLPQAVDGALQQLGTAEALEDLGVGEEDRAEALAPRDPVEVVDTAGEREEGPMGAMVAFAATILLFIAVQFNGNSLLTGAIEEKSSRVVEVLLGAVRPWQLLSAKLIALTLLSLAQIGVLVATALGANRMVGAFELPPATGATVAVSLVMVVVGFTFFAGLYTVAGAMASSVEDAQGTAGPLAFLLVGVYMVVIFAVIPAPNGTLAQVLTYLPPTAPFTVPARVAMGAVPTWQVALAVVVTLTGTLVTLRLAARLYAAAILGGGKLTWREAWRAEPIR
jgi:ABC-2 type transport system permease protein